MRRTVSDEWCGRSDGLLANDALSAVWLREAQRWPAELLPELELRAELTLLALDALWADAGRFTLQLALQPEPGRKWMKLQVEQLEDRALPAVALSNGVLALVAEGPGPHTESVAIQGSQVIAYLDGVAASFPGSQVQALVLIGSPNSPNVIQNTTPLPAWEFGGNQADTIFQGTGSDAVFAGEGPDVVYALVGKHVLFTGAGGADRVYTNPNNLTLAGPEDRVVTFFAVGRTPGSGSIQLDGGTLYVTPSNNGSFSLFAPRADGGLTLYANLGDGSGLQTFQFYAGQVRQLAEFGGTGNDVILNFTGISEAFYGSAGNDLIQTGTNDFGLAKGSGGNDTILAFNNHGDYSGNGGSDTIVFFGNGKKPSQPNVYRIDLLDRVFGNYAGDLLLTP